MTSDERNAQERPAANDAVNSANASGDSMDGTNTHGETMADMNAPSETVADANISGKPVAGASASADAESALVREPSKRAPRARKIVLWTLGVIVGLIIVVIVGFNIYIRTTYSAFYSQATEEFEIPGIHAGFICQDLDYYDDADCWFFSGYAAGDGASPLYRRNADGSSAEFFAQLPNGSPYTGHGSGITTSSDFAFLTCDSGYLVFRASDLVNAREGDVVTAIDQVDLELTPAFMNIENDTLYVGTFHLLPDYEAPGHHHLITPDGSENAGMMFAYPADAQGRYGFASQADRAYSLPDKVQGASALPNGDIVLSTSYGFNTSHLLTYRIADQDLDAAATSSASDPAGSSAAAASPYTFFVDGRSVPLFFLDSTNLVSDIEAPPMTEGIEFHDGRVWISEESASNKYLFGKLYGAGDVFSLPAACFAAAA